MKNIHRFAIFAMAGISVAGNTVAQGYPNKPVRIVVPFSAGGAADTYARVVSQKLSDRLGQPFIIENRAGAGGTIAGDFVAKSAPDGHTLFAADIGPTAIAPGLYKNLPYNPQRDFTPIQLTIILPIVLITHPSLPVKNVKELVVLARARPGQLDYVSAGSGGIAHLAAELFKNVAGIDMLHIPTKGGAQQVIDLMGGHAQLTFTSVPTSLPHVRAGKLRALAAAGPKRSRLLPDVPTIAESGYKGYAADSWGGFAAPARTSGEIISRLNTEMNALLQMPEVREKLAGIGFEVAGGTPAEFGALIRSEIEKWAKVVKLSGARADR